MVIQEFVAEINSLLVNDVKSKEDLMQDISSMQRNVIDSTYKLDSCNEKSSQLESDVLIYVREINDLDDRLKAL